MEEELGSAGGLGREDEVDREEWLVGSVNKTREMEGRSRGGTRWSGGAE